MKKGILLFIFIVFLISILRGKEIDVANEKPEVKKGVRFSSEKKSEFSANSLSGVPCANSQRRPFGVMLAEDREARPLSGVSMADLVIEMPVVTGSITRMLAFFVCDDPEEIGSVRSARHDFVSLAQGYDAIFAYWGGSQIALEELKKGRIDALDALPNYFDVFYRKVGVQAPHNGFTSMRQMVNASAKLGYRMTTSFEGYKFLETEERASNPQRLEIHYRYPYNVRYEYEPEKNSYARLRGDIKELDALNGKQVEASNIVVMRAKSRQIGGGYNDVDILGTGEATVYRNGEGVRGRWEKKEAEDPLRFFDEGGEEIQFIPGKNWIEVVEPSTLVTYK